MTVVFLLRHGETRWNREEVFRGRSDVPLNDFGRKQAKALGEALLSSGLVKNPAFIAGPLSRATETAQIVASALYADPADILTEEAFNDICFGEWEGKTLPQVEQHYPELFKLWRDKPHEVSFPGGEKLDRVGERSEKALYRLVASYPDKELIIVSHRAVNKILLLRLLGLRAHAFWKIQQNTACLNELHYKDSEFILVRLNETCHLRDFGRDKGDF